MKYTWKSLELFLPWSFTSQSGSMNKGDNTLLAVVLLPLLSVSEELLSVG